jgi:Flp pilus assembly protein CpaB
VPCIFAKRDIEPKTHITTENFAQLLDRRMVQEGQKPPAAAGEYGEVVGKVVVDKIRAREAVVKYRLASPEEMAGLSYHIEKGKRAVTVKVEHNKAVGGFIGQGDIVDLIGSFSIQNLNLTKYVMQKVKILAINTIYVAPRPPPSPGAPTPAGEPTPTPPPTPSDVVRAQQQVTLVTFEVTPEEAERIILASENARLYMVLRSPDDKEEVQVQPVDDKDVYLEQPKKPPVPKRDILIWKGLQREEVRAGGERGARAGGDARAWRVLAATGARGAGSDRRGSRGTTAGARAALRPRRPARRRLYEESSND